MKEKIKKYLNSIKGILKIVKENFILLLGVGLFVYGLFNFESSYYCGEGSLIHETVIFGPFDRYKCIEPATYYYYSNNSLNLLAIGVIFIIIGLIKLKTRNSE